MLRKTQYSTFLPCGTAIPPNNPHAISVSLPSLSDVIGYEEQDVRILSSMQSGYPRFFRNKFVQHCKDFVSEAELFDKNLEFIPVANALAAQQINKFFNSDIKEFSFGILHGVLAFRDNPILANVLKFLQNTGYILSSRVAEEFLYQNSKLPGIFNEYRSTSLPQDELITSTLKKAYGCSESSSFILSNTGMSAFYSAFTSIKEKNPNKIFLQLGWLYLDSMDILSKYGNAKIFINMFDIESIESFVNENHADIAAIVSEIPSNPLMQVPDYKRISAISRKYGIPFVVDISMGTAYSYPIAQYADMIIESLTKFASGSADVMMGSICLTGTDISLSFESAIKKCNIPPSIPDVQRLAFLIEDYKDRVEKSSNNTVALIEYFKSQKGIAKTFHALLTPNELHEKNRIIPPVITLQAKHQFANFYNSLPLAKGPSFGTTFTLVMPYVYLAHYGLIKSRRGKKILHEAGLHPDMIRISVGCESIDSLIDSFNVAFAQIQQRTI